MASETLHFENARFAQQLFNNDPKNLQALEDELASRRLSREGWIKLDGAAEAIERAKQLFRSAGRFGESRHARSQSRIHSGR